MKKSLFIIALSIGMVACSSDATTETTTDNEATTETGGGDKVKEMERLSAEREDFYNKHIQSLENGNMAESNAFKAQMDSVEAIYQEVLRK